MAYVDTAVEFGFYTEVVESSSSFLNQVRSISDTCADWDGRDPVRIMTRGGYRVPEDPAGGDTDFIAKATLTSRCSELTYDDDSKVLERAKCNQHFPRQQEDAGGR